MEPRLPLYGRSPRGLGTPLLESLTGFVARLAFARHVPTSAIFDRLVRPLVPEGIVREHLHLTAFLSTEAAGYDGLGRPAEALVGAMRLLTGLSHLDLHTLLPWRRFLVPGANRALHWRRPKRWCALCLAEWRSRGEEPWEPLLWRVGPVRRCPEHRVRLSSLCSHCHKAQGLVAEIVPFGYCRSCGQSLEAADPVLRDPGAAKFSTDAARWEWWTACAVARMLASQRLVAREATSFGFPDFLRSHLRVSFGGRIKPLAQYLGVGWNTVDDWVKGKRAPSLDFLLAVCMRLRAAPLGVVLARCSASFWSDPLPSSAARPSWPPIRPRASLPRSSRRRPDPHHLRRTARALREILRARDAGGRSATAVAKRLGVSGAFLKQHFPREHAQLRSLNQQYRAWAREERFRVRRGRLRAAVAELVREGAYPSKRKAFARARLSSTFSRMPRYSDAWLEALREHGVAPS